MTNLVCLKCGAANEGEYKFCFNCGSPIERETSTNSSSNPIGSLTRSSSEYHRQEEAGNYQPRYTIHHLEYEEWQDKHLITTTTKFYVSTDRVGPSILLSDDTPSPILYVIISAMMGVLISGIIISKLNNRLNEVAPGGDIQLPIYLIFFTVAGPFIGYYIGSAFVSTIMRSGFHNASDQYLKSNHVFRRLWGYLLLIDIIGSLFILSLTMDVEPVIYVYYSYVTGDTYFVAQLPDSYVSTAARVGLLENLFMMAFFLRAIYSLEYSGKGIYIILVIWVMIVVFSYFVF